MRLHVFYVSGVTLYSVTLKGGKQLTILDCPITRYSRVFVSFSIGWSFPQAEGFDVFLGDENGLCSRNCSVENMIMFGGAESMAGQSLDKNRSSVHWCSKF